MKSMTGYGRGDCAQNGYKITVELTSVNRRQSEVVVYLPHELESLEVGMRDEINQRVARGRLTVKVTLHSAENKQASRVRLNKDLVRSYVREINQLAKDLKLSGAVTLDVLMRAPGVLQSEEPVTDAENFWEATQKALRQAIQLLVKMREREGAHLAKDLTGRMATLRKSVGVIQRHAPQVARRYREQLRSRIQGAGVGNLPVDEHRLLQEVVFFADRSDISEELTRLQSHFQQFDDCLKSKEPVGRTLDFLAQEMNREVNTLGAKANDALISREVVTLKAELEKFREQVQNVE
jgi:uncharacterized protein (TIGR00255 family)